MSRVGRSMLLFGAVVHLAGAVVCGAADALPRYVAAKDDSFAFKVRRAGVVASAEFVELIMTSQTWRDVVWKHQLFIVQPSSVAASTRHALLLIAGGDWKEELDHAPPAAPLPNAAAIIAHVAEQLATPVAVLLQVPAQPILEGRREDALIAHTFDRYLETHDDHWPLLLPMVKSAVRAMDAVQHVVAERWSVNVESFTVTGASKRGWTTWLTGAVDPRAEAIAPMVIDMLNIGAHLRHQVAVWGNTSDKINDYTERDLHRRLETPPGRQLQQIIDPYHYLERLQQAKLIICGTNDRYWPLDAANLYWADLLGPKWMLYVPNNGHGLRDLPRVLGALHGLHRHATGRAALPVLKWSHTEAGDASILQVRSGVEASRGVAWVARSATRDFRDAAWTSVPMTGGPTEYRYRVERPARGYMAFFGELVFARKAMPLFLSTTIKVLEPLEPATP